jgi:hypothetical protein
MAQVSIVVLPSAKSCVGIPLAVFWGGQLSQPFTEYGSRLESITELVPLFDFLNNDTGRHQDFPEYI